VSILKQNPGSVSFFLGVEPITPSEWWKQYLRQASETNDKQCDSCSKLRAEIRDIVIRQKDDDGVKKIKGTARRKLQHELDMHRFSEQFNSNLICFV
jgi:hypothetical protein